MKRHSLDDESTHPGSLIAGSRLPPKRGLTWPGSTLVPSYSVESDYAPGPWSAAAAAADEAAAELDPVRAAPEAISRSQPDFGGKMPLSPFKQRVAQARAQELEPIDDDAAAPTCWFCGLGGGGEASDAAPDASVTILDALGFRSDAESAAASWTTDSWFSASGAVPPPK